MLFLCFCRRTDILRASFCFLRQGGRVGGIHILIRASCLSVYRTARSCNGVWHKSNAHFLLLAGAVVLFDWPSVEDED